METVEIWSRHHDKTMILPHIHSKNICTDGIGTYLLSFMTTDIVTLRKPQTAPEQHTVYYSKQYDSACNGNTYCKIVYIFGIFLYRCNSDISCSKSAFGTYAILFCMNTFAKLCSGGTSDAIHVDHLPYSSWELYN